MLGNIIGDIVGSIYEGNNIKSKDFLLFAKGYDYTDDSLMTLATANWLCHTETDVADNYIEFASKFKCHRGGYGSGFPVWLYLAIRKGIKLPYNSCGNGSAMRGGPVGWVAQSESECLLLAKKSAECTHNHQEGIKGAQAVAYVYLWHEMALKKRV